MCPRHSLLFTCYDGSRYSIRVRFRVRVMVRVSFRLCSRVTAIIAVIIVQSLLLWLAITTTSAINICTKA